VIKLNPLTGNFDDVGFPARTITGTTNQVTVTNGDGVSGNPTLSLPQDIHTGATPTFARLIANGTTSSGTTSSIHTNWLTIFPANGATGNVKFFLNNGTQVWETFNNSSGVYGVYNNTAGTQPFEIKTNAANAGLSLQSGGPITKNIAPLADSTYTNGTSSLYWSNTYTDKIFFNSTATIDGATAGALAITGLVGLGTTAPTHTLTLPSTSTGIALYNTADQTTNFERVRAYWSGNVFNIFPEKGGTGTARALFIGSSPITGITLNEFGGIATSGKISLNVASTGASYPITASAIVSSSSASQVTFAITPTINQSSTAGYTALLINPTETTTGTGTKLLIDAQVGGVSKFKVDNTGRTTIAEALYVGSGGSTSAMQMNYRSANIYSDGLAIVKRGTTGDDTAALTNNTEVGYHSFHGWTGTVNKRLAYVIVKAKGAIGDSSGGGTYNINTRGDAGNTEAIRLVIDENGLTITDAHNIVVGTTTGTKIGTATSQKLGFFNATPVVQPASTSADATDLATAITLVNNLKAKLISLGLIA
jgi:hypothetical protein